MFVLLPLAFAQDVVSLEAVKKGQVGTSIPHFGLVVNQKLAALDLAFSCGSLTKQWSGPANAGQKVDLPLELGAGKYTCKGSISVLADDGSEGSMPLSFAVEVLPPLQIRMAPGSLDVANRRVSVILDRASSRVEVTVRGPKGVELGGAVTPKAVPAGTPIEVQWSQSAGEAMKLLVRGFDADGFYSDIELSPWRYSVPHEDVVFATNSAVIESAEEPKLQAAMVDVQNVLDKYGSDVIIKLYVAGHTDTVGDTGHNQTLSLDRAKSIANWFKRAGFKGDIFYQGLGERDQAVATADSVDEPKNRRVTYVLAAQSPEIPADAAGASWALLH